jgi:acyl-coenzyme A thioesterase PaaI-like protein
MTQTTTSTSSTSSAAAFAEFAPYATDKPDYAGIRATLQTLVPFNNLVGLQVVEVSADRGVVTIPDRGDLLNTAGTVHAGALFLAADLAGAAAFLGALAPRLALLDMFALRDCRTVFLRPCFGAARVSATVDAPTVEQALVGGPGERFSLDGKALVHDSDGVLVAKAYLDLYFSYGRAAGS